MGQTHSRPPKKGIQESHNEEITNNTSGQSMVKNSLQTAKNLLELPEFVNELAKKVAIVTKEEIVDTQTGVTVEKKRTKEEIKAISNANLGAFAATSIFFYAASGREARMAYLCALRTTQGKENIKKEGVIHPGWVKTDMGGANGLIDVQTSVTGMLKEAEKQLSNSHADVLHRFDGEVIAW